MRYDIEVHFPVTIGRYCFVMHLDERQSNIFFDAMDSLLYFVNKRFDVIPDFDMEVRTALDETKAAIISRTLWENAAIVDDYCDQNPASLTSTDLADVRLWRNAISGVFTVVRYQDGRAILMNDAGVFSVMGITIDIDDVIGPAPAHVETTLIPYRGRIVYDGFLQAYDAEAGEISGIQDEFETRVVSEGLISSAEAFCICSQRYRQKQLDAELDALLSSVSEEGGQAAEEKLPDGFHRGVFAEPGSRDAFEAKWGGGIPLPLEYAYDISGFALDGVSPLGIHAQRAARAACACVLSYGLITLDFSYKQYSSLDDSPLSFESYSQILRDLAEVCETTYAFWAHDGIDYLYHYTLGDRYVTDQVIRFQLMSARNDRSRGFGDRIQVGSVAAEAQPKVNEELRNVAAVRKSLIEQHRELEPKNLSKQDVDADGPIGRLWRDPSVKALVSFLDAHVPDGQNDQAFAVSVVEEIIYASIEVSDLNAISKYLEDLGLIKFAAEDGKLVRLVTNVFNTVPSWENFGWSGKELMEGLTGRRIFFADDGRVLKVGSNDLCPCGSGKTYRDCCGR